MPPRFPLRSYNVLEVPAYLATDMNAPELKHWQREHPDWFIAGTWTAGRGLPDLRAQANATERVLEGGLAHLPGAAEWTAGPLNLAGPGFARSAAPIRSRSQGSARQWWWGDDDHDVGSFQQPYPIGTYEAVGSTMVQIGGDQFAGPGAPENDPRVEAASVQIDVIATRVTKAFDAEIMALDEQLSPNQYGTRLHARIAKALNDAKLPGIRAEVSFRDGTQATYAELGTIRADVVLRDETDIQKDGRGRVLAVWDFKTGLTARLSDGRMREIRRAIDTRMHISSLIPVFVYHTRVRTVMRP